jgi:hypothetical protein
MLYAILYLLSGTYTSILVYYRGFFGRKFSFSRRALLDVHQNPPALENSSFCLYNFLHSDSKKYDLFYWPHEKWKLASTVVVLEFRERLSVETRFKIEFLLRRIPVVETCLCKSLTMGGTSELTILQYKMATIYRLMVM